MIFRNKIFKLIFSVFAVLLLIIPLATKAEPNANCSWTPYVYRQGLDNCRYLEDGVNRYFEVTVKDVGKKAMNDTYCGPRNYDAKKNPQGRPYDYTCCCLQKRDYVEPQAIKKKVDKTVNPPTFQISLPTIKLSTLECHNLDDGGISCSVPWIAQYVTGIYDYGLAIGGILAAIILMAGGLLWLISGGDASKVSKAKSLILSSITGLIILFSSYIILYEINPELTKTKSISLGLPGGAKEISEPNEWKWDAGIKNQIGDASPELIQLLNCMRPKLEPGVGRISSISDSNYIGKLEVCNVSGCDTTKCAHSCQSCHYGGGRRNANESYAVDFGDEEHTSEIIKAAYDCGAKWAVRENEGKANDHIHVSVTACLKK